MRIGELSRRTGVSVPTIKYYVREGLLPAGRLSSPNQASYDEGHERRLRLIRALLDEGGLSVAAIREVLAAVDDTGRPVHKVLGEAADRLASRPVGEPDAALEAARNAVAGLLARRGWRVGVKSPQAEALAGALAALQRVGHGAFLEMLDDYADAAERVARADLAYVARNARREDLVESAVVGTVLGDAVLASLRRLAHVDASARAYGDGPGDGNAGGGAVGGGDAGGGRVQDGGGGGGR
ncbi:MerR family transcriptional regulator [Streptomyces lavendofoliae]|uniref:MerR family transcriptional regulator n=1 Tax=Streptomyces lavendofoliae TaxID=67314 RepID=A0A918I3M0_9ACTN|nr:MerR family transcriptional regulator [Streptomyces lavendofoliae]GGU55022.1 MerR family transcriptional regulator [Streptomyces lavendofoliae]